MRGLIGAALLLPFVCASAARGQGAAPSPAPDSPQAAGQQVFLERCAACHGTKADGGEFAPSIISRVPLRSDDELKAVLHDGLTSGMPAFPDLMDPARSNLISFLRSLKPQNGLAATHTSVILDSGEMLHGVALNRSAADLQLLTDDHKMYLLRRSGADRYRAATSQTDWPNYDGPNGRFSSGGSRYSELSQINASNVARLRPEWIYSLRDAHDLQSTPTVSHGLMYVTSANECYALDAGSGRLVWHYRRPRTQGIGGVSALGINRGTAIADGKVFMVMDNGHLIALDALTGALLWDTAMVDWHENYNATSAPLLVGSMVISGVAGGDDGARGFVAAFSQQSGKEIWRFWSVPRRGEPGAQTWKGNGIDHPSGATWMTGVYDAELDTIYWPIGNPGDDLIGDDREGDNLYTDSVVALDPRTGKMKWYFQFTPHDVHDFDAAEPLALIDTDWEGKPRKLLVQANRNGFLYVLDRTDGRYLLGKPYTPKLTWATGLTAKGRPIIAPGQAATREGTWACPWLIGASNWYSSSYSPLTGLYYVQTNDKCGIYTRKDAPFEKGRSYMGGSFSADPKDPGQRFLRAFDIHTGSKVWQIGQTGAGDTYGGVLSSAGGVVFYGADDGSFAAVDARDGAPLWHFQTNQSLHASPMTYEFDHRQFVAITAGTNVIAFALPRDEGPSGVARNTGVKSPRLYVFDCGTIHLGDLSRLSLSTQETGTSDISVACFLVVHPQGTLMWDTGAIPDSSWTPTGSRLSQRIALADGQTRQIEILEPLTAQLRAVGYSPDEIEYLALSHYHYDHTGNANLFANATWLVREEDRSPMFATPAPGTTQPSSYDALKHAKTIIIDTADYDVFGDGTVIIKFAPGHTPGHQVLSLKLANSGRIVLSGDLYHFPAERQLGRVPAIDSDAAQTRASRAAIESFIAQSHAQLWIQHDIRGFSALKKAPQYYD